MRGSKKSWGARSLAGLVTLFMVALVPGPASAMQLTQHSFSSSFDGTGVTEGKFGGSIADLAVDEATDNVYVATIQSGFVIDKFNGIGVPSPFSSPSLGGGSSLNLGVGSLGGVKIAVDNSSAPSNGNIYAINNFNPTAIFGRDRSGSPLGGSFPVPLNTWGIGTDPTSGNIWIPQADSTRLVEYAPDGTTTGVVIPMKSSTASMSQRVQVDSAGNIYVDQEGVIQKYNSAGVYQYSIPGGINFAVDQVSNHVFALGLGASGVSEFSPTGAKIATFGSSAITIAVNGETGRVYLSSGDGKEVNIYAPGTTVTVPDANTEGASDFHPTDLTLHGTVDPDGIDTTDCHFEWSTDSSFANSTECAGGNIVTGSGPQPVSAVVSGLTQGQDYNYRLVTGNANGTVYGREDFTAIPSAVPSVGAQWVSDVHSDGITFHGEVNSGGAKTSVHVEYGLDDCGSSACASSDDVDGGSGLTSQARSTIVHGLEGETVYHYRFVATNQSGTEYGEDHTFSTFPTENPDGSCANSHVRQQTGAALLDDCRAYELVSAADTGGYNVESDLTEGQHPFLGYPSAGSRALYGVHSGAIPGPWTPTNRGVDPYLAVRGPDGWSTDYVGIPANAPSSAPFASDLAEANSALDTFAFGGADICDPCFQGGFAGTPLHLPNGKLVQGMAGSSSPASAAADGLIGKRFSTDGTHYVFGSTTQFEPDGNPGGDVSIYDRSLKTGVTQVVSKDPLGENLACLQGVGNCHSPGNTAGISELDISADGSRIVVGQLVSTDPGGNHLYHLYMHIGSSPNTIDLTPGATAGATYNGMTADGSRVFLTTSDHLLSPDDGDASADIYEADVDGSGPADLTLISTDSTGNPSNDDSCDPSGLPSNWNAGSGDGSCNALGLAGGAGLAAGDGTFLFLSPEMLDTSGGPGHEPEQDQPNLYVVEPGGAPEFVATVDSSVAKPAPRPKRPLNDIALVEGLSGPRYIAVDESSGDIYVLLAELGEILRFDSSGAPKNFTAGPGNGTNRISGLVTEGGSTGIAVDNSGGPSDGNVYVVDTYEYVVRIYDETGAPLGTLNGSGNPNGYFEPTGVTVDQDNGDVYITHPFGPDVWRYSPSASPVTEADYSGGIELPFNFSFLPREVAAGGGRIYVGAQAFGVGEVRSYSAVDFTASPTLAEYKTITTAKKGFAVDPATGEIHVDKGNRIEVFDSAGTLLEAYGNGDLSSSNALAINGASGHVYVNSGEESIVDYGFINEPIDNPLVVHAARQPQVHTYGDLQISPDGEFAAFSSLLPLTGYDNAGHYEVFRYETDGGDLICVSCNPTNSRAVGDSRLAPGGLGLTEDGRVFFNSSDPLVARDLDSHWDAYQWSDAGVQLISTGLSPFDSSLLGVSSDGTDAFFFTRDSLVPQDKNGSLVKLYDARAEGGFPFVPATVPCKASDECHGPGSEAPAPPSINTIIGSGGNETKPKPKPCKRGKVRRHGKCVPKKHRGKRTRRHR